MEQALAQEIADALGGLGPVCVPAVPLPDGNGDGVVDCNDGCPADPLKTAPGLCGCGIVGDADADGVAGCGGDCDDGNGSVWGVPGEVPWLDLAPDPASPGTLVSWTPPAALGGLSVVYDLLSSSDPADFDPAECVVTDGSDITAVLTETLSPGEIRFILVRAENLCPGGSGTLGSASDGVERPGRPSP